MPSTSVPPPAIDALPRQTVRDPDYWLLVVAFLLLFLCGIQLLIYPFGRSQAAHALLARAIVAGHMPVRDAWISEAPGIGLLHAAIQVTLGRSMMAFRAIETIAVVGVVLGATRITKRWVGLERAGLVGGALFALTYIQLEVDQTGQPEFFAGVLLLHSVAVLTREPSPRTARSSAGLIGLLLGLAILLVPALAVTAVPFATLLVRRQLAQAPQYRAPFAVSACFGVGLLAPLSGLATWFLVRNAGATAVADWLQPTARAWLTNSFVDWAAQYCELTYSLVLQQSALITAGLLATFTLGTIHEHEAGGRRLLLLLVAVSLIGLVAQHKDNPGSLMAVLPLVSTLAGIGVYKAWRRMLSQGAVGSFTFAAIAILLFQMCGPASYSPRKFLERSKVRLLYVAGLAPYRSREMLESELYNSKEYSLTASRKLAADLRERSLTNSDVWVLSDDPQLAWLLDGSPRWRFIRPVPPLMARMARQLDARIAVPAFLATAPKAVVIDAQADSSPGIGLQAQWRTDYATLEAQDAWTVLQRVPANRQGTENSEFCDPNVN